MKRKVSFIIVLSMLISMLTMPAVKAQIADGWTINFSNVTEGVDAEVFLDNKVKYSGENSLYASFDKSYLSMRYVSISQKIPVETGKTYVYGMKIKTNKANRIITKINQTNINSMVPLTKTYDWMDFHFEYTHTGADETVNYTTVVEDVTKGVWIDDVYFYEKNGDKTNLVKNSGFEGVEEVKEEVEAPQKIESVADTEALLSKIKSSDVFNYEDIARVMAGFKYSAVFPAKGITIDGENGDWQDYTEMNMPVMSDQYYVMNEDYIVGGMDATATYKFCYDENNLYILINVKDNTHCFYDNAADYWKGDSVQLAICAQGHTYDTEISFVHNEDEKKGTVYSAAAIDAGAAANVKLSTKRVGDVTTYEAAVPWDTTFVERPEKCLLSFLVNENDGLGRAYLIEVAPKGISIAPKTSIDFPLLELVEEGKDWYAWIEGPAKIMMNEESIYDVYLVNRGGDKQVKIDIPLFESKETVVIPANSGIRRQFKYVPKDYGEKNIECIFSDSKSTISSNFDVFADPSKEYFNETIEELKYNGKLLQNLIRRCKKLGINPDYEEVRCTIYNRFIEWFEDDLDHKEFSRSEYTLSCLKEIYEETKTALYSYLNGSAKPLEVPKYVVSDMEIDGSRIITDAEYKGEIVRRPMFMVGMHMYDTDDIQYLPDFGYNNVQIEIGVSQHMKVSSGIKDWMAVSWGDTKIPDHTLERTTEEKANGNYSLKMVFRSQKENNLYRTVYQSFECKPNTTYYWGFKAKAENASAVHASPTGGSPYNERVVLPEGTYDWTSFDYTYTTGDEATFLKPCFIFNGPTSAFYIDDYYVYEAGSDVNLIKNPGFEEEIEEGTIAQHSYDIAANKLSYIKAAEENNVSVDLLLTPHYFLNPLFETYKDLKYPGEGFIKFYYDHPIARKVMEEHIETLIKETEKFDCINSICVINEPWHTTNASEHYREGWIEHLKNEYNNDISKLNTVYGTDYADFADVPYVYGTQPSLMLYDYVKFNDSVQTEFIKFLVDTVRKYTDKPVHSKTMMYFGSDDTEKRWHLGDGADPENLVDFTDINGNDSELRIMTPFDTYLDGKILQKSILYDFNRSLKEAPVYNSEDHIANNEEKMYDPAFAKNVRSEQWMSAMHGRSMTSIWNWDRSRSRSYTADGLTFRPDVMDEIAKSAMDLNRLSEYVYEIIDKKADCGVYMSKATRVINREHVNAVYKIYENIIYQGIKPMFAADSQPELMHKYDILFMPDCKNIPLKTLNELKAFVDSGKKLVIFGKDTIEKDEHGQPLPEDIVSYVKSRAEIYDIESDGRRVTTPDDDIYNAIDELTKDKQRVVLIDSETGKKLRNAEWQWTEFEDINGESGMLINMSNYDWNNSKTVKLYIDGNLVENEFELRSNKAIASEFVLESFSPILIKVVK